MIHLLGAGGSVSADVKIMTCLKDGGHFCPRYLAYSPVTITACNPSSIEKWTNDFIAQWSREYSSHKKRVTPSTQVNWQSITSKLCMPKRLSESLIEETKQHHHIGKHKYKSSHKYNYIGCINALCMNVNITTKTQSYQNEAREYQIKNQRPSNEISVTHAKISNYYHCVAEEQKLKQKIQVLQRQIQSLESKNNLLTNEIDFYVTK